MRPLKLFEFPQDVLMLAHTAECANRHTSSQEPNGTLRGVPIGFLSSDMAGEFRNALMWHMERHETKIADLVKETGVTRSVINKLRSRPESSTDVENGILIAAYYGKSLSQFINKEEPDDASRLTAIFELLPKSDRQLLEAQIQGILRSRVQPQA